LALGLKGPERLGAVAMFHVKHLGPENGEFTAS